MQTPGREWTQCTGTKKNKESTPNATLMPLLMFYLVYLEEEELKIIAKLRQNQEKNIEQTKILEVGQQGG